MMKIALTDEERQAYVKCGYARCPYCKSDNLDMCERNSDSNWIADKVQCFTCEKSWQDIYELVDIVELI